MEIAIGRKEIMRVLHVQDWGTIRNWKRQYSLPVRYLPSLKPFIFIPEVEIWMKEYSEIQKNQSGIL